MREAPALLVRGNVSEIEQVAADLPEPGKTAIAKLTAICYNDGSLTENFFAKFDFPDSP